MVKNIKNFIRKNKKKKSKFIFLQINYSSLNNIKYQIFLFKLKITINMVKKYKNSRRI